MVCKQASKVKPRKMITKSKEESEIAVSNIFNFDYDVN